MFALAWTYRLGRDVASRRVGLFAAALLGTSALFVFYSHELRMYTAITAFSAYTLWIYHRIVSRPRAPSRLEWLGLFLGVLGVLYTHYYASIVLLVIGVYHLLFAPKNRRWFIIIGVMAAAGLLFVPWIPYLMTAMGQMGNRSGDIANVVETAQTYSEIVSAYSNHGTLLFVIALAGAVAAVIARRRGARTLWFFAIAGLLILVGLQLALQFKNTDRLRYSASIWPLWALVLGLGLSFLWRWRPRGSSAGWGIALVAVTLWIGLGHYWSVVNPIRGGNVNLIPMQRIMRDAGPYLQPQDLIISFPANRDFNIVEQRFQTSAARFYVRGSGTHLYMPRREFDPAEYANEIPYLVQQITSHNRLWVEYPPNDTPNLLAPASHVIQQYYDMCPPLADEPNYHLDQYAISAVCCLNPAVMSTVKVRFGDSIGLATAATNLSDKNLEVSALWSLAEGVPIETYSASWQLFNAAGDKVGQADYGLAAFQYSCHKATIPLGDLPPGQYMLRVAVYAWETQQRLPAAVTATGETGDLVPALPVLLCWTNC
jgi:hypothetical protein